MSVWNLGTLRTKVRQITGRLSTGQLGNAELDGFINAFYQLTLPEELNLGIREGWWEFDTAADDDGVYPFGAGLISVEPVIFVRSAALAIDEYRIANVYSDPALFKDAWPDQIAGYTRSQPADALIWKRELTVMPPPNGIYSIRVKGRFGFDAGLVQENDEPIQQNWGFLIAYGTSIEIHMSKGEKAEAAALADLYTYYKSLAARREVRNLAGRRSVPRW